MNPRNSETYDLLKQAGQPNLREVSKSLPLYWGPQPFTAGPMYMGAVTVFLFLLALICYRGKRQMVDCRGLRAFGPACFRQSPHVVYEVLL